MATRSTERTEPAPQSRFAHAVLRTKQFSDERTRWRARLHATPAFESGFSALLTHDDEPVRQGSA